MRVSAFVLLSALVACTPGAPPAGAENPVAAPGNAVTIPVSLTGLSVVATAYGTSGGYTPAVTTVAVGTTVRFLNVDSFAHTATAFGGATFPAGSPLGGSALTTSGATLSSGWSSGNLAAGAASQTLLADKAGTYLYGCFFHYGAPMRAAIVVR
ncbi:hypothetical protein WPS_30190 [Vulcanimicrobium alpinum]|uniref:Blue (type 1) copper domain-containing protein n=1 Tax=Vulcanimicrobium alpinum TaxID=3016050 RepID=A0AAN1XYJ6_UNVUL|nr:plastocyanin/azurin family copper-binding protein [Vulcanimicrobium alpinum]BDE07743.1 hypothetical protein WPS_30190 [Vulcanimicrobium alpinum]